MEARARAEALKAAERRAALAGELAAVEAKLAAAAVEGEHEVLAGMIETGSGIERALSAALGERLRASVVGSISEGVERLAGAEGAARALVESGLPPGAGTPPVEGARRLLDLVEARGAARARGRAAARRRLAGRRARAAAIGLRRYRGHRGRRVLRRRRRRAAAVAARRAPTPPWRRARSARSLPRASASASRPRSAPSAISSGPRRRCRPRGPSTTRPTPAAARPAASWMRRARRRAVPPGSPSSERRGTSGDEGQTALRRAQLEAELAAERRHVEAAVRAREARDRDRERLERRITLERETLPALGRAQQRPGRRRRAACGPRRRARRSRRGRRWRDRHGAA